MSRRHWLASGAEIATFARTLVGGTSSDAARSAARYGCTVRDRSEAGWYTDEHDPRRINIVVRDGIVVEASVG